MHVNWHSMAITSNTNQRPFPAVFLSDFSNPFYTLEEFIHHGLALYKTCILESIFLLMNLFLMGIKWIFGVKHFSTYITLMKLVMFFLNMFCHGILFLTLVVTPFTIYPPFTVYKLILGIYLLCTVFQNIPKVFC